MISALREANDVTTPLIGRTLGGKFIVESFIGGGGMGAVYRARQIALDRAVAIKVLQRGYGGDPMFAGRFHREAKAASRIDHPNLIRILDYGEEPDGLLYIAMEFLAGRDLLNVLDREWPLPHERVVDILSQTLAGLAEAHDARILHRDLKPENIMVLPRTADDGSPMDLVKVCDFGIAKIVEAEDPGGEPATIARKLSMEGLIVGTPEYMSPEQARGEALDARSDLYAVGVILYQLLTRRLPFEGSTALSIVLKAQQDAPAFPAALGETIAPSLEPICLKAMSKRPEDRYASAREMRAALRAASPGAASALPAGPTVPLSHAPTLAELRAPGPPIPPARATPPARPGRSRWWLLVVVASIAGLAMVSTRREPPASATHASPSAPPPSPSGEPAPVVRAEPPLVPPSEAPSAAPAPALDQALIARAASASTRASRPPATATTPIRAPSAAASDDSPPEREVPTAAPIASAPAPSPSIAAPVVAPTPLAQPTIAPAPAPPTPSPAPPFDPRTARVDVGQPRANNAAATAMQIGRAVTPFIAAITACYRSALSAGAEAPGDGTSTLHLETDDQGYVVLARVTGPAPADAARCIEALAVHRMRIAVDTGTANADVPLLLHAR